MKKNNTWGSFERCSAAPYCRARHVWYMQQGGFGTVEYLLITGFLVAALLTPFSVEGDAPQNVVQRLLGAVKSQHQAYLYAASLPVRLHPDGWSGGGPNDNGPGDIFGDGGGGPNDDPFPDSDDSSGGNADDQADDNNSGSDSDGGSDGSSGDGSGSGSSDDSTDDPDNTVGNDNNGSDGSDDDVDIPWKWLAAGGAMAYCLATPPEDTVWAKLDIAAYEAAKAAYHTDGGMLAEESIPYDERYQLSDDEKATGFSATLTKVDGQWILAFRGTEILDGGDWAADARQALSGSSAQYDQAVHLAIKVATTLEEDVLYVGHSLGGGMAAAAAYATGGRAITFNAAGLHPSYRTGSPGEIRAHYIVGEALTTLQKFSTLPDAPGIPIPHSAGCFSDPVLDLPIPSGPLQRHRIIAFEDSLSRWLASQETSGNAKATATRVSGEIDHGLRIFVPPAQRRASPAIQASP